MQTVKKDNYFHITTSKQLMRFLIPSIIGVLLFITPVSMGGQVTIPIALLSRLLQEQFANILPQLVTIFISITALLSLWAKLFRPAALTTKTSFWTTLCRVSPFWLVMRVVGMLLAICTLFQIGPEWIWSESTGGMLLYNLLPLLFTVFLFAGLFMPLLMNFGLLEFCGTLCIKVMRPLFKLPGRSSVNCITSWLGDGTIGVLLTSKQYEQGFYTKREAAVISTTFSAVSITFCFVVLSQVNLAYMFVPFYLTVTFAGLISAIIMPRIPPLSRKADTYHEGVIPHQEDGENELSLVKKGLKLAVARAGQNKSMFAFLREGSHNVLDLWLGVTPIIMAVGTVALIIADQTPIFAWLGLPFTPLLELLQIPEAQAASQTLVAGFADMFLPTVLASGIQSELTRFVIACISVTQLIYMSEVGGLLLGSRLPVTIKDLLLIFLLRTLITLPIIAGIAHLLF
ncbi:YjiH family protein [Brevibacillus laterosporus]|uniref:YjiH family protein n=1 Tax=Brevibacillus laterosporus TaxID=1465 RepID=UPI00215B8220|nr:YjiH family protein [Brevibacillus laterosporus]MCR8940233.1 YjiH family protein [Brevibacillus laterosporus]MCZ0842872.1 YjiH family protein [Brevibacillus laterosporus]MCZ0847075.1 YjiH family protein [Brevibacillus laterosporus]